MPERGRRKVGRGGSKDHISLLFFNEKVEDSRNSFDLGLGKCTGVNLSPPPPPEPCSNLDGEE